MVIYPSDYRWCEMPLKCQRKEEADRRGQWSVGTTQEAVERIQSGEIGKRGAELYYWIPERTLYCCISSANLKKMVFSRRALLGMQTKNDLSSIFSDRNCRICTSQTDS
jgi:hypothetical protein